MGTRLRGLDRRVVGGADDPASSARTMSVRAIPGLEHLPYAEAWLHSFDDAAWRAASEGARRLGKTGLEVWTTAPEVAATLERRGYEEVRRYVVSELDVASAPDPGAPALPLVTLAEQPDLADGLFALARIAYADQPGRGETRIRDDWYEWGLRAHPPEACFVALEDGTVLGYGYLEAGEQHWTTGFLAVAREARGRGVAGAIKRAQVRFARGRGIPRLRTANEVRLVGLLDLNRRLGYVPLYEEIVLRGPLSP